MREILFRGQTRKFGEKVDAGGKPLSGKWVYGGVLQGSGDHSVIYGDGILCDHDDVWRTVEKYPVHSETVGQYTELRDCDGNYIFEGDIIKFNDSWACRIGIVRFDEGRFLVYSPRDCCQSYGLFEILRRDDAAQVIGNVYDNPELI